MIGNKEIKVNNISDTNAIDLTDGDITNLHNHNIAGIEGLNTILNDYDIRLDDLETIDPNFAKSIYFNSTNPATATIFDIQNPPVTDLPAERQNNNNIYFGTDASTWIYNRASYVTYTPTSNNWQLGGNLLSALGIFGTKSPHDIHVIVNNIVRAIFKTNGNFGVKQLNPIHEIDVSGIIRALNAGTTNQFRIDPMDVVGPKLKLGTSADPVAFWEMGAYNSMNNFDNKGRDFKIFNNGNVNAFIIKAGTGYVGVNTSAPISHHHINGSKANKIDTISATTSLTKNNNVVYVTNGGTAITITLVTPVGNSGLEFSICRGTGSTGAITINPSAGQIENLNGALSATTTLNSIGLIGAKVVFISNGSNWVRKNNG